MLPFLIWRFGIAWMQSLKSVDYNACLRQHPEGAAPKLALEVRQALNYSRAGIGDKSRLHRAVASPETLLRGNPDRALTTYRSLPQSPERTCVASRCARSITICLPHDLRGYVCGEYNRMDFH